MISLDSWEKRIYNRVSLFECLLDTVPPPVLPIKSLKPCAICVADITYEDKSLPCKHVRYGTLPNSSAKLLDLEPLGKAFNLSQCWSTDSTFLANTSMTFEEMERIVPDIDVRISLADGTYEEKQKQMLEEQERIRIELEERENFVKEEAIRLQEEQLRREKEEAEAAAAAKEAQDMKMKRAEELAKAEMERVEVIKKEKQDAALKRKADKEAEIKAKKEAKAAAAAEKEAQLLKKTRMRKGTMMDSEAEKMRMNLQIALSEAATEQLREAVKENDIFAIQSALTAAKDIKLGENEEFKEEFFAAEQKLQNLLEIQKNEEETISRRQKLALVSC